MAAIACYLLNADASRRQQLPADAVVTCTVFAPPCVMSKDLADACRHYVSSVVLQGDPVPNFSLASIERLRLELLGVDWRQDLKSRVLQLEYVRSLAAAIEAAGGRPHLDVPELQHILSRLEHGSKRIGASVGLPGVGDLSGTHWSQVCEMLLMLSARCGSYMLPRRLIDSIEK